LHPTVYENNKTIYPYVTKPASLQPLYALRTSAIYKEQVKTSEARKKANEKINNGSLFIFVNCNDFKRLLYLFTKKELMVLHIYLNG